MEFLLQDVRHGTRILFNHPGFTAVAVLTLALGIGASTAIFGVVNGVLSPLPYRHPDRLAIIWTRSPGANVARDWPSPGQFAAIKADPGVFDSVALAIGRNVILSGAAARTAPVRLGAVFASSAVFTVLGAEAELGRVFTPEDDTPGKPPTAILTHGLWQRRFGSNPRVVGEALTINGSPYTVVGVMPKEFSLGHDVMPSVGAVTEADLLLSLPMERDAENDHGNENYNVLARLRPGVTIARAQVVLDLAARRLEKRFPEYYPASRQFGFLIRPLLEQAVGDVRWVLYLLVGTVTCVLLIACANVANLQLARATTREEEMALRVAIGATRGRIVRQLLTESLLLAMVSGALGLALTLLTHWALRSLEPGNIPRLQTIRVDYRVLVFTVGLSVSTGVLFGLAPALHAGGRKLGSALREGGRGMIGGPHGLRNVLVVVEFTLSLVLLVGAGLLVRSFSRVQDVDPGFAAQDVLSMRMALVGPSYADEPARVRFFQLLWQRLRELPGVRSVGGVSVLPLAGGNAWGSITIEGYEERSGQKSIEADQRAASVGYFETLRIPLRRGRFFTEQDTRESRPVVIVDETFAKTYWPHSDPLGRRIKPGDLDSNEPWLTVVGVVTAVKQYALDDQPRIALYRPHLQSGAGSLTIVVRTDGDPQALATAVTNEARALDPNLPLDDVKTMDQWLSDSLARRRFVMLALTLFAVVALTLAGIGIYGVMSYSVAQRSREIGIRLAMGADGRDVLRLVVGQGMSLAGAGLLAGLVVAAGSSRLMSSWLFGVGANDPVTFLTITTLLAGVALLASMLPARRAARIDPAVTLRSG